MTIPTVALNPHEAEIAGELITVAVADNAATAEIPPKPDVRVVALVDDEETFWPSPPLNSSPFDVINALTETVCAVTTDVDPARLATPWISWVSPSAVADPSATETVGPPIESVVVAADNAASCGEVVSVNNAAAADSATEPDTLSAAEMLAEVENVADPNTVPAEPITMPARADAIAPAEIACTVATAPTAPSSAMPNTLPPDPVIMLVLLLSAAAALT